MSKPVPLSILPVLLYL